MLRDSADSRDSKPWWCLHVVLLINNQTHNTQTHRYAYSGGGRGVARVDVSIDGGKTWEVATIKNGGWRHGDYTRTWYATGGGL